MRHTRKSCLSGRLRTTHTPHSHTASTPPPHKLPSTPSQRNATCFRCLVVAFACIQTTPHPTTSSLILCHPRKTHTHIPTSYRRNPHTHTHTRSSPFKLCDAIAECQGCTVLASPVPFSVSLLGFLPIFFISSFFYPSFPSFWRGLMSHLTQKPQQKLTTPPPLPIHLSVQAVRGADKRLSPTQRKKCRSDISEVPLQPFYSASKK